MIGSSVGDGLTASRVDDGRFHRSLGSMPSDALLAWQTDRIPRLQNVEADCLHLEALHAANPNRVQEYIRSYAVLLSSEFQGFCRDLHDESTTKLVATVNPITLRGVLRS